MLKNLWKLKSIYSAVLFGQFPSFILNGGYLYIDTSSSIGIHLTLTLFQLYFLRSFLTQYVWLLIFQALVRFGRRTLTEVRAFILTIELPNRLSLRKVTSTHWTWLPIFHKYCILIRFQPLIYQKTTHIQFCILIGSQF